MSEKPHNFQSNKGSQVQIVFQKMSSNKIILKYSS